MTDQIGITIDAFTSKLNTIETWSSLSDPNLSIPTDFDSDYPSAAQFLNTLTHIKSVMDGYSAFLAEEMERMKELGRMIQESDYDISTGLKEIGSIIAGDD